MRLARCKNKSTCKNDTEIDDFIAKNNNFVMIKNEQAYLREDYSDDVVLKYSEVIIMPMSTHSSFLK